MLLQRLHLEFCVVSPDLDETPLESESVHQLVQRLAQEKSSAIAARYPQAVVIGSDQVAIFENEVIGKPGTCDRAIAQLRKFSGKNVQFLTAVRICCLESGFDDAALITTEVNFRALADDEIRRYVELDQAMDCAGSFKSEAAGISLLESMISNDPTAIIGLPLIAVSAMLRKAGFTLP